MDDHPRGGGEQPQGYRRRHPPGADGLPDRRVRLGEIHAGGRHSLQGRPARPRRPGGTARTAPRHRGRRLRRRGGAGGSAARRPHPARQSAHVHQGLRPHPPAPGGYGRCPPARPRPRSFLLQRGRRALRNLPGRGGRKGRNAVSVGRLPSLPGLRRPAVPAGGARRVLPRQDRQRHLRADGGSGPGVFQRRKIRGSGPAAARRRGPGIHPSRSAHQHPVRRRGPAPQALALPAVRRWWRQAQALHLRRAYHRSAFRGHSEAAGLPPASGRGRSHGVRDRAQHGRGQDRRLGDRSRTGRRR